MLLWVVLCTHCCQLNILCWLWKTEEKGQFPSGHFFQLSQGRSLIFNALSPEIRNNAIEKVRSFLFSLFTNLLGWKSVKKLSCGTFTKSRPKVSRSLSSREWSITYYLYGLCLTLISVVVFSIWCIFYASQFSILKTFPLICKKYSRKSWFQLYQI